VAKDHGQGMGLNDVIDDLSQRFQQKPHPAEKEKLPEQE
jgi:hypothetical protein